MPELYSQCSRSIMFQMHFQWNKLSPYGSCTVWNSCVQRHPKIQLQLVHSCNMRVSKAQTKDVFIHSPRHIIDLPPSPPNGPLCELLDKKALIAFQPHVSLMDPSFAPNRGRHREGHCAGPQHQASTDLLTSKCVCNYNEDHVNFSNSFTGSQLLYRLNSKC